MHRFLLRALLINMMLSTLTYAQETPPAEAPKEAKPEVPAKIEIKPTARDHEIRDRLAAILQATGWFVTPKVQVEEGVVFLQGLAKTPENKKWAGELARNTQDVSAVVNKMELVEPSIWDFQPTLRALRDEWREVVRVLPSIALALIVFLLTWGIAKLVMVIARKLLKGKLKSQLLLNVTCRSIWFAVILIGLYIIFRMLGLTTVALTIIGGTGILGIVLGIAFRDITENLLSSILLSIHHPFKSGDLVEINQIQGYIQRLTIRSTVLITLDGNHVQIPNATVYKSNIRNFSVNPNRQEVFTVGIGDNADIPTAQEIALKVLENHPAVLKDPEPWVLADSIEKSVVNLRIYFWLNGNEHGWLKVRSSVIRLIKKEFKENKIYMPGDSREIFFSGELPVRLQEKDKPRPLTEQEKPSEETGPVATNAEGGLRSEIENIQEQARQSRTPEKQEQNLLDPNDSLD